MSGPRQFPYRATFKRDVKDTKKKPGDRRWEAAEDRYVNLEEVNGVALGAVSNDTTQYFQITTRLYLDCQTTMRIDLLGRDFAIRFVRHDRKKRITVIDCAASRVT